MVISRCRHGLPLLYWEQTALLYVLSTLAMCGFLLVVAFSNLEVMDKEFAQPNDDQQVRMSTIQTNDEGSEEERAA